MSIPDRGLIYSIWTDFIDWLKTNEAKNSIGHNDVFDRILDSGEISTAKLPIVSVVLDRDSENYDRIVGNGNYSHDEYLYFQIFISTGKAFSKDSRNRKVAKMLSRCDDYLRRNRINIKWADRIIVGNAFLANDVVANNFFVNGRIDLTIVKKTEYIPS